MMALTHALAGRRIKYQASLGLKHRPLVCSCAPTSPPLSTVSQRRWPRAMFLAACAGDFPIWYLGTLLPSNLLAFLTSPLVDRARRASQNAGKLGSAPGIVADWGQAGGRMVADRHTKGNLERRSVPRAALGSPTPAPPSSISRSPLGHCPATTGPAGPRGRERPRENYITAIKTCVRDLEEAVRGNGNVRLESHSIAGHFCSVHPGRITQSSLLHPRAELCHRQELRHCLRLLCTS